MLRLIVAVGASFVAMMVLITATQAILLRFLFHTLPEGFGIDALPPAYLLASGVCSLIYAVIAGCISAAIGRKYEAPTILGALMLGMAIGGIVIGHGNQPMWYAASVPLVSAIAATAAGYRWLARQPIPLRTRYPD